MCIFFSLPLKYKSKLHCHHWASKKQIHLSTSQDKPFRAVHIRPLLQKEREREKQLRASGSTCTFAGSPKIGTDLCPKPGRSGAKLHAAECRGIHHTSNPGCAFTMCTTLPERSYTDGGNIIQQTGLHGETPCRGSVRGHNSALPLAAGISCQGNRMGSDRMPIPTFPKKCVALQVSALPEPHP